MACLSAVFVLFCGQLPSAFAQNPDDGDVGRQHKIDSLRALLPTASMEEKGIIYAKLTIPYHFANDLKERLDFYDEYIGYARETEDVELEGLLMAQRALAYHNLRRWDEYLPLLPADMEFWSMHGMWKYYFAINHIKLAYLILNHRYETAVKEAEKMYALAQEDDISFGKAVARMSMGAAYYALDRYEEARKCFREAIDIFYTVREYPVIDLMTDAFDIICQCILRTGEYTAALPVLTEWDSGLKNFERKYPDIDVSAFRIHYCIISAEVYAHLGDSGQAEEFIRKVDRTVSGSNEAIAAMINKCRVQLYLRQGMYDKALQLNESLIEHYAKWDDITAAELMQTQAEIADITGNSALGHSIYRQLYHHSDSLNKVKMAAQLDELHTIYEVDKLTMDNDRLSMEKDFHRKYMLLYLAGCCLLLVALIIWIVYSRRLDVKNHSLVARILEQDRLMEKMKSSINRQDNTENSLLETFNRLMSDPEVFTDSSLNRRTLSEMLHSDEAALQELVAKHFACSVAEYISERRLNHARELLTHHSTQYTVEAIAVESGFGNRRTFYRQFQQRYGVTPGAYRIYTSRVES